MNSLQKLRLQLLKPKTKTLQKANNTETLKAKGKEVKRSFKDEDVFLFI